MQAEKKHKLSTQWLKDPNKNKHDVIYGPRPLTYPTHYNNQNFQILQPCLRLPIETTNCCRVAP